MNESEWLSKYKEIDPYSSVFELYLKYKRAEAIQYFLNECSIKFNEPLIKNVRINIDDRGGEYLDSRNYIICYNKNVENMEKYCGPDPFFYNWPSIRVFSFETTKNDIIMESQKEPIIDKVGWVGNIYSAMNVVSEHYTRPLLKKIGDEHSDMFEIIHVDSLRRDHAFTSIPSLTKYKYLIDIGGNGWSGRLKFLLFMKRPLLIVDRNYLEYFYKDLIPYTHYIPVKMDLSDLLEQVLWMQNNYEKSLEIANNAYEFAINNFTLDKFLDRVYYVYKNIHGI